MNDHVLNILGLVIGVIGVPSAILAIVAFYARPSITLFKEDILLLFDSITKNFPHLSMTYQNKPISKNFVLIKGAFINTGSKDIVPEMVEKPIELHLPPASKWIDYILSEKSENLNCELHKKDDATIVFRTGLLKRNEFFKFQGLAEITDEYTKKSNFLYGILLDRRLKLTYRISDLTKVSIKRYLPNVKGDNPWPLLIISIALFITAVFVNFDNDLSSGIYQIAYPFKVSKVQTIDVSISAAGKNFVSIDSDAPEFHGRVTLDEFLSRVVGKPKIIANEIPKWAISLMILTIGLFLLFCFLVEYNIYRFKRLLNGFKKKKYSFTIFKPKRI